ncbi:PIN domain-containing protein [Spiribacter sp. C176]|uniref:PIN domain-containing protein n=1 Tax=Spiribacter salilacus TaxID=2664894 RepID=A0A6N7QRD1_9GAMM|nr:PIN domain-containing protein [Spiribacter salilacus]MRH79006.1 PIN domain-containing protein [Spiribacter salilacus]
MAAVVYLDTHVVVHLYGKGTSGLPDPVVDQLQSTEALKVSPMVRLELQYLSEIGRVGQSPERVLDYLSGRVGLQTCEAAFGAIVHAAQAENWTRDPFDRLIVAQARLSQAALLTKDRLIHQHYLHSVW